MKNRIILYIFALMKKGAKLILACILSFTIAYVGGLPQLINCYCACCCKNSHKTEANNSCCGVKYYAEFRPVCMQHPFNSECNCSQKHKQGCKDPLLKIDLQKETHDDKSLLSTLFFYPAENYLSDKLFYDNSQRVVSCVVPPPYSPSSRFYLSLYSTLLI